MPLNAAWRTRTGAVLASVALVVSLTAATRSASAAPPAPGTLKINEVESSGGVPGDWVELVNTGAADADIGGYTFLDNDDTHTPYAIPAGASIPAGGYYVLEEAQFGFGLGSAESARLFAPGATTPTDSYSWTAHAATTYGRCPDGTGAFTTTASATKGATNDCGAPAADVKINEVESSGGTPGDWIEVINNGATTADISGYVVKDDDDAHVYTIPGGTTIPAGGYYVAEEAALGFGLGSADSARLFAAGGTTLVDSSAWTAHAINTYGRCPNGTGAFAETAASTKGLANVCPGDIPAEAWPGGSAVSLADDASVFGTNLSGLAYQPSGSDAPGVLWAVRNGPSTLYRLLWDGTKWAPDTADGWSAGKQLRYPDGTGDPDAEGVTLVGDNPANGIYVSTERNNQASTVSRPAVLRFDVSAAGTTLSATNDWNLTADLPVLGPNLGLEAVAWMSDAFLQTKSFTDELTNAPYDPGSYPGHGSGLFFVGAEQNGVIYAYALNQSSGSFSRVATIPSGFTGVMDLAFEPETSHLWAACDDTCNGRTATLDIAQSGASAGRFVVTHVYERPAGMANLNNEGFAIAPQDECVDGKKPVFWSDDSNTDGHALRAGTLSCTVVIRPQTITFAQPAAITFGSDPVALVATSTSGLPVSFSASGPCSVTDSAAAPTLTALGAGTCTVTAKQPGNARFAPAPDVARTVTIKKAPTSLGQSRATIVVSGWALKIKYTAVLTSKVTGRPLAGQTITFTASSFGRERTACAATTDGAGRATCTGPLRDLLSVFLLARSSARFAGTADYEPSASTTAAPLF